MPQLHSDLKSTNSRIRARDATYFAFFFVAFGFNPLTYS